MIGIPLLRRKEDETPISPAPDSPIPEIFSTNKVFFLSSYNGIRRSEIPRIESDYCPRDDVSQRLFHRSNESCDCDCASDGCCGCLRRNKQCCCKILVLTLSTAIVVLLFSSLSYNLTRKQDVGTSLETDNKSEWTSHYHKYNSSVKANHTSNSENAKIDSNPNLILPVRIINKSDNGQLNNDVEKYPLVNSLRYDSELHEVEPYTSYLYKVQEAPEDRTYDAREPIEISRTIFSRRKRSKSESLTSDNGKNISWKRDLKNIHNAKKTKYGVVLEKFEDIEKGIKYPGQFYFENARTVFQPFSLTMPDQSTPAQSTEYSFEANGIKDELKYKFLGKGPADGFRDISEEARIRSPDFSVGKLESETSKWYEKVNEEREEIDGAFEISHHDDTLPKPEKLDGVKGISLAEAKGEQKNTKKHFLLNSRVVGGSSDIRLPTAPDVSKPFMNAFETLKTSQQLSFTPSAASQFIFPYQMCFYANPHLGPRTSVFSSQPRTLPLRSLPLFSSTFDKGSSKEQSPQQNIFSLSINNYASAPRPPQQIYSPPSGGSVFAYPSYHQVSQYLSNVPAPQGQPLFCTYLQPPLLQFPTVPGTADFGHAKCVDCENNHNYVPSSRELFFPSGREIICADNSVSCKDGSDCIPVGNWCDNEVHCKDVSDEMFCSCRERVARERLCDGYVDCPQGEDEVGCFDCPKSAFSCDSAISPESCIPLSKRCDGQKDCATGADETDCSALFFHIHQNDSYLVPQTSGYLHRNWKGTWYPVCVEIGNDIWAKEACLGEVGFSASEVEVFFVSVSHQYKGPFIVRQENGTPALQDHCKGHVSTYVKCSSMKCGTRVEPYSLQEFENRFRRFIKKDLEENFPSKRDGTAPFGMSWNDSKKQLFPILHSTLVLEKTYNATRVKKEEIGRVVGGKESEPRAWPWIIAIYKDGAFHCGGIILDEKWALTAAHCMEQYWKHFYEVRGGMLRRFSFSAMEQIRTISAVIVHENYDSTIMSNDLALLRLQNPFNFNRWVRPACLPSFRAGISKFLWGPTPGTRCIAVGWGALRERGADPDQLREVEIPIMAQCKHKEDLVGAEICAGKAEGGKDTCQGDSGGPLLCRDSNTPSTWYVAGIVSHGEGCGRPGEPGAYTRLSLYVDWITTNTDDFQLPSAKPLKNCPGFRCSSASRLCIPTKWVCNGFTDCLEAEDEMNCTAIGMDSDNFYIPYTTRSSHRRINEPKEFLSTEENSRRTSAKISNSKKNEEIKVIMTDVEKNKMKNAWHEPVDEFKDKIKENVQFINGAHKTNEKSLKTTTSQYESFLIQKGELSINEEGTRLLSKIAKIKNESIDLSDETRELSGQSSEEYFSRKNDENYVEINHESQIWLDGNDEKAVEGYLWNFQNKPMDLISPLNLSSVIQSKSTTSIPHISSHLVRNQDSETVSSYSSLGLYSTLKFDETSQGFSSIGVTESFKYVTDGVDGSEISDYFECKKINQTILAEYRCDGVKDCEDDTDELNCTCLEKLRNSNPQMICNGEIDCIDLSDEKNCSMCSKESYKCKVSHECIPLHERCDGVINCRFGEDENNCLALGEINNFQFNDNNDPLWLTKGLLYKNKNGIWDVQCQEKTSGFDDGAAIEVCSCLGTIGYEKYENKSVNPDCTGFYVTCSEGLTSSLKSSGSQKDYLFPWNAFVYYDGNLICSAVLIYPEWLLTSASCLKNVSLTGNHLVALLGSLDSDLKHYNPEMQLIPIDDIIWVSESDMAILYLRTQVNQTRFVRPTGIPYTFDSNPEKNVCIAVGDRIIFLKMLNDCSRSSRCYTKTSLESLNCFSKPWKGVIVCQSRLGWYPSSVFHEEKGYCGFRNVTYRSIQENIEEIFSILEKRRESNSEFNCSGFQCPEGFCIPDIKVCDGWPDCPSKKDEHIDICHKQKNKKECGAEELKCGSGLCVGKISFADGINDCGDKSDEPLNSTCVEYLRLTAPQRICDGNRNCYDKTDENINFCPCNEFKFKCSLSQHCIPQDFVCDGIKDCPGGEDEELCMGQKVIKKHNLNQLEIFKRSYGVWHTFCPSLLSKELSDSLCRGLGYKQAAFTYEKNETVLLPQLNHFSWVQLNNRTKLALRGDRPLVRLVRTRRICGAVICT